MKGLELHGKGRRKRESDEATKAFAEKRKKEIQKELKGKKGKKPEKPVEEKKEKKGLKEENQIMVSRIMFGRPCTQEFSLFLKEAGWPQGNTPVVWRETKTGARIVNRDMVIEENKKRAKAKGKKKKDPLACWDAIQYLQLIELIPFEIKVRGITYEFDQAEFFDHGRFHSFRYYNPDKSDPNAPTHFIYTAGRKVYEQFECFVRQCVEANVEAGVKIIDFKDIKE